MEDNQGYPRRKGNSYRKEDRKIVFKDPADPIKIGGGGRCEKQLALCLGERGSKKVSIGC